MPKINTIEITNKSVTMEKLDLNTQGKINNIGNLSSLKTTKKDTLVNSINELYNTTIQVKNIATKALSDNGISYGSSDGITALVQTMANNIGKDGSYRICTVGSGSYDEYIESGSDEIYKKYYRLNFIPSKVIIPIIDTSRYPKKYFITNIGSDIYIEVLDYSTSDSNGSSTTQHHYYYIGSTSFDRDTKVLTISLIYKGKISRNTYTMSEINFIVV